MPFGNPAPRVLAKVSEGAGRRCPLGIRAQRVLAKARRVPGADALWKSGPKSLSESTEGAGRRCPLEIRAKSLS